MLTLFEPFGVETPFPFQVLERRSHTS